MRRITGRGAAATVASVLFVVLAFLSVPALWVHNVMLDSQKFTDITVEATTDPTTAAALGDAAGTAFVTGLNLEQRLAAILPDRLTVIAGPVADGIQHGITTRTTNLLTSEGFASTWRTAIQGLYERFLAVMRGTAPNATLNGSTLTIDVKGAVMNGLLRLQQGGIIPADVTIDGDPSHPVVWNSALTLLFGPEPPDFGAVPVLDSPALASISGLVGLLDTLAFVLPVLALVALVIALWATSRRTRLTFRMGAALGVALAIAAVIVLRSTDRITEAIARPNAQVVIGNLVSAFSLTLVGWLLVFAAAAAAIALVAWVADRAAAPQTQRLVAVPVGTTPAPSAAPGEAPSPQGVEAG